MENEYEHAEKVYKAFEETANRDQFVVKMVKGGMFTPEAERYWFLIDVAWTKGRQEGEK